MGCTLFKIKETKREGMPHIVPMTCTRGKIATPRFNGNFTFIWISNLRNFYQLKL